MQFARLVSRYGVPSSAALTAFDRAGKDRRLARVALWRGAQSAVIDSTPKLLTGRAVEYLPEQRQVTRATVRHAERPWPYI